jgi:hypothetical protein
LFSVTFISRWRLAELVSFTPGSDQYRGLLPHRQTRGIPFEPCWIKAPFEQHFSKMQAFKQVLTSVALFTVLSQAHTWIEQLQVIGSDGSYTGDYGYPRGYVARTDPSFTGDSDNYLLPPLSSGRLRIDQTDLLCHPSQRTPNYSAKYPKLAVAPGDWIAMKYLENGHVTQPWVQAGKPSAAGTVYVYGTTTPDSSAKILDVLQWTADGKGGNGKGFLIGAQDFDDGRCHQISNSAVSLFRQQADANHVQGQPNSHVEQWCETDIQIPKQVDGSSLTVYWVWSWQTAIGSVGAPYGKDEYYTTCMDFDVGTSAANAASGGANIANRAAAAGAAPVHTLGQQDPQLKAVSDYSARTALTPMPTIITAGQTLVNVNAAGATTISMAYRLPGETYTASSTTWVLEPQGTALMVNGVTSAYVDCSNVVKIGNVNPACPGRSAIADVPPTVATTASPTTAAPSAPTTSSAVAGVPTQSGLTTVFVTVTAPAPHPVVMFGSPAQQTGST